MNTANNEYLTAQFLDFAPCSLDSTEFMRVKLTSDSGQTNWLNIDAQAARDIEAAIERSYQRKHDRTHRTSQTVIEDSERTPPEYDYDSKRGQS